MEKQVLSSLKKSTDLTTRMAVNYKRFKIIKKSQEIVQSILQHRQTKKYFRSISYCIEEVSEREKAKIEREVQAYIKCSKKVGQSIKQYSIEDRSNITFLTKYFKKSLLSLLVDDSRRNKETDEINTVSIMRELAQSLKQLHREGLIHNQISLQRIFIKEGKTILSLPYFSSIQRFQRKQGIIKSVESFYLKRGSIYFAPELAEGYCFSKASDVWALGVVFLELLLGKPLSQKTQKEEPEINLHNFVSQIKNSIFRSLIEAMLSVDVNKRANVEDVLNYLMFNRSAIKESQKNYQKQLTFSMFNLFQLKQKYYISFPANSNLTLEFIFSPSQKLRWYELLDSNNLLHAIIINIFLAQFNEKSLQFQIFLSDSLLSTSSHSPIDKMNLFNLSDLLKRQKLGIKVADSGEIIITVSQEDCKECKERGIPKILERISRCVASIQNKQGEMFEGLLIDSDLVLTTAITLRKEESHSTGPTEVRLRVKSDSPLEQVSSLTSFEEGESNCLLLELQKQISRLRYITLVSNYSEGQTIKKLNAAGQSIIFHYQAGSSRVLTSSQINFLHGNRFEVKVKLASKVQRGCPLLIVFSHNQCYAIGLFDHSQGGVIFGEKFYWFIWSSLQTHSSSLNKSFSQMKGKMIQWQHVDINQLEPIFMSFNSQRYEQEQEYFLENTPLGHKFLIQQLFNRLEMNKFCESIEMASNESQTIISLYEKLYGPQSIEIALQKLRFVIYLLSLPQKSTEKIDKLLEQAFVQESKSHHNVLISLWSLLMLAGHYNSSGQNQQPRMTERTINKIWSCLSRIKEAVENLDSQFITNWFAKLMGAYYLAKGNIIQAEHYYQKASDTERDFSIKSLKIHLMISDICKHLSHNFKAVKYLMRAYACERRQSNEPVQQQRSLSFNRWLELSAMLLESNSTTAQEIDLFIELTQKYVHQKAADIIPIFEEKRRRIQNRL